MNIIAILFLLVLISAISTGPGRGDEPGMESIAAVSIPIPMGMKRAADRKVELSVPGFRGGQAAYGGDIPPEDIIEFYKTNMPLHGWESYASLVTGGGLLVYVKTHQSVLIMVGTNDEKSTLAIMVGTRGPGGEQGKESERESDLQADP